MLAVALHRASCALIAAPSWITLSCAALLVSTVALTKPTPGFIAAFAAGAIAGLTIPSHPMPPSGNVLAYPVAFARGIDLFDALQRLDDDPQSLVGTRVSVSGLWRPAAPGSLPAVYRTVMACCLADAIDVGFDVLPSSRVKTRAGTVVRVSGVVSVDATNGEIRYRIVSAAVRELRTLPTKSSH
jgi:hypothetical protein